jgi:hypothetical protein
MDQTAAVSARLENSMTFSILLFRINDSHAGPVVPILLGFAFLLEWLADVADLAARAAGAIRTEISF